MRDTDFTGATWRKSGTSNPDDNCVEVARVGNTFGIRDSKSPAGSALRFTADEFRSFVNGVRAGEFD